MQYVCHIDAYYITMTPLITQVFTIRQRTKVMRQFRNVLTEQKHTI